MRVSGIMVKLSIIILEQRVFHGAGLYTDWTIKEMYEIFHKKIKVKYKIKKIKKLPTLVGCHPIGPINKPPILNDQGQVMQVPFQEYTDIM